MSYIVMTAICKDGKYLLFRRPDGFHNALLWEFPGARKEPDETDEECAAHAMLDKFNISVKLGDFLAEIHHQYPDKVLHIKLFRGEIISGTPDKKNYADMAWVPADQVLDYDLCGGDRALFEKAGL